MKSYDVAEWGRPLQARLAPSTRFRTQRRQQDAVYGQIMSLCRRGSGEKDNP
jgi:hypothetical protein